MPSDTKRLEATVLICLNSLTNGEPRRRGSGGGANTPAAEDGGRIEDDNKGDGLYFHLVFLHLDLQESLVEIHTLTNVVTTHCLKICLGLVGIWYRIFASLCLTRPQVGLLFSTNSAQHDASDRLSKIVIEHWSALLGNQSCLPL